MITKEQIEAGCEIWAVWGGKVYFSSHNFRNRTDGAFNDDMLSTLRNVPNVPEYHPSKHEAELYLLECVLNDN